MLRAMLLLALIPAAGCYRYSSPGPVDTAAPEAGRRISVRLTEQGALELAPQLGNQVTMVQGDLVGADPTGLELAVVETEDERRITTGWKGERVTLPRHFIAGVQERRFSPGATGLVGAIIVGSMAGAYALFGGTGEVVGPTGGPSPGNQ